MEQYISFLPSLCLGVCLSACAGFRIFVPLLLANLALKFHVMPFSLGQDFSWLGTDTALIVLIAATIGEILAYYLPFVDNLLDTIATPTSIVAGTILTTSILQIDDPSLRWALGIIAGGGVAGTISAGTSLLRLGSSKFTGGVGNPVLATIENIFSIGLGVFSFFIPVLFACCIFLAVVYILRKLMSKKRVSVERFTQK